MSFFDNPLNILILIPITLLLMFGSALFYYSLPMSAQNECFPYVVEGYDTKIVSQAVMGYECWIKHEDKYVPLKKWLAIKGVGE